MAYYDALIAKWPSLTGASVDPSVVSAAQAAFASGPPPVPTYPGPDASPDEAAAYEAALAEETTAQQAWQESFIPPFTASQTVAKITQLNAITQNGQQLPLPILTAVAYLREQGAWLPIKAAAAAGAVTNTPTAAQVAAMATIDLYEDTRAQALDFTLAVVAEMMSALVSGSLLTQTQADTLTAMSFVQVPWWQANGYSGPVSPSDLEAVFVQSNGATVLV